jgi:predicted transcriptional regulator
MSFRQLKSYLDFLLGKELLCVVSGNLNPHPGFFKTTGKGREFLKTYRGLKDLVQ